MSVNKIILLGTLGRDPEVRTLDGGIKVATVSLATNERGYTTKAGVDVPERTEWHNLVFWRGLAETVEKYTHKGDKVYIEGKMRTRSYDGQDGTKRYVTEVFVDQLELLTPKRTPQASTEYAAAEQAASNPFANNNNQPGDLPF